MPQAPARSLQLIRQWQSETEAIRHADEPYRARAGIWALTAMIVVLLGITPLVRIDRVVTSSAGKVVSDEALSTYQALDPSIIKSVDVKEGQQVDKGQLLATLDSTFAQADVGQLRQQVASLDAQIARARAELGGKPLAAPLAASLEAMPYVAMQKALFDQRAGQYAAQLRSFDEKIKTTQATIAKYQADEVSFQQREQISQKVEGMRDTLYKSGASSLLNLLQANDARLEMQRTREFGHNSLIEAQHQLSSLQADRESFMHQWSTTTSQELVQAENQRDQALASLQKADKHRELVRLTASEPAVVLSVSKLSVGSVLKEGDELMKLVPLRASMSAEIHIPSREIGFVRPGDPVSIKVDAFNYFEHGYAEGRLAWISEGTFTTDENGSPVEPYYKARVTIGKLNFVGVPETFRLIPGMTLSADVNVGTRSVMAYIMGGFFRGAGEAMREP